MTTERPGGTTRDGEAPARHELVLVGGGHAHVEVLHRWARAPVPGVRLSLVVDDPVAVYSGMVPGFVAGRYTRGDLEIDVRPLARRAGARCIVAAAVALDAAQRRLTLEDGASIGYETVSLDVGSAVGGLDVPGVREHALPTRPIGLFVRRIEAIVGRARGAGGFRLVIVGAGAGGVELAFAFATRLRTAGTRDVEVLLLEAGPRVLPGYPARAARLVEAAAAERGVRIVTGARVRGADARSLALAEGEPLRHDALVWVVGAASLPLLRDAGLETDADGFVRVGPTLQCVGREDAFAVGDCASWAAGPPLPKAGVYAVRQGPVLAHNLRARARGRPLRRYRPQRDFLTLLNLSDGTAIAAKWGLATRGAWTMRLKDRIDRRFVRRFQVERPDTG